MIQEDIYEVSVKWDNDRQGTVAAPAHVSSGIERTWTPEYFFTAAVNSCLINTFIMLAETTGFKFKSFESKAIGKVEMVDGKYMMSQVTLMPTLTISNHDDKKLGESLLQRAEANCLMANSVKSKIFYDPTLTIDPS